MSALEHSELLAKGEVLKDEVKCATSPPRWLERAMKPLADPGPLSKYDLGMRAILRMPARTRGYRQHLL